MKKIIFSFLIIFFLFSNDTISQKDIVKNKYKIIKIKADNPKNIAVKPKKIKRNYVWINGCWKRSFIKIRYMWVKGKWKRKKDFINGSQTNGKKFLKDIFV